MYAAWVLHAFQMLCPGCVARGIPQAQRVADLFAGAPLAVVGLHTVFEHHAAMKIESLRAFVHEYRVRFPVGVDAPDPGAEGIPQTMRAYGMRGTPTTISSTRAGGFASTPRAVTIVVRCPATDARAPRTR